VTGYCGFVPDHRDREDIGATRHTRHVVIVSALPFFLARKDQQPAGRRDDARTSEEPEMILWLPFGVPESSLVYPLVLLYPSLASAFRSRRMVCFSSPTQEAVGVQV
jgi:hypothetical protein